MRAKMSLVVVMATLAIGAMVATMGRSPAQTAEQPERQAVAAVAATSVTEYEPDPFEPQRLRSSTVRVREVAVVYSDGSVEVRRVGE